MRVRVDLSDYWEEWTEQTGDEFIEAHGSVTVTWFPDPAYAPMGDHVDLMTMAGSNEEGAMEVLADYAEERGLMELAEVLRDDNNATASELRDRIQGRKQTFKIDTLDPSYIQDEICNAISVSVSWPCDPPIVSIDDALFFELFGRDGSQVHRVVDDREEKGAKYVDVVWDATLPYEERVEAWRFDYGPLNDVTYVE